MPTTKLQTNPKQQIPLADDGVKAALLGFGVLSLFGICCLACGICAAAPSHEPTTPTVRPGQSPAEVRDRLGPPIRVARQVLFRHYVEQWVYDAPQPVRVEFHCSRGRDPYVSAVHP